MFDMHSIANCKIGHRYNIYMRHSYIKRTFYNVKLVYTLYSDKTYSVKFLEKLYGVPLPKLGKSTVNKQVFKRDNGSYIIIPIVPSWGYKEL